MTTEALITMLAAWGVILFFSIRFLIKALKSDRKNQL